MVNKATFPRLPKMNKHAKRSPKRFCRDRSRGAVIIEMAVCLPLMLMVVFGCIEANTGMFRGQTLTSAAHEGALLGLKRTATAEAITNRIATVMNARGINDYTMNLETFGTPFEDLQSGEQFRIELSTEMNSTYITARTIEAAVTALRP